MNSFKNNVRLFSSVSSGICKPFAETPVEKGAYNRRKDFVVLNKCPPIFKAELELYSLPAQCQRGPKGNTWQIPKFLMNHYCAVVLHRPDHSIRVTEYHGTKLLLLKCNIFSNHGYFSGLWPWFSYLSAKAKNFGQTAVNPPTFVSETTKNFHRDLNQSQFFVSWLCKILAEKHIFFFVAILLSCSVSQL
jgi:hypothetical protein